MTPTEKSELKGQLAALTAMLAAQRGLISGPLPPLVAGPVGSPIFIQASLTPLLQALNMNLNTQEKLATLLIKVIDKL